jgi:DNA-binding MarR family transcriptional regulator
VTRLVDRLENAGLVARERCDQDRRVVWVTLTKQGEKVLKKLDAPVEELHETQFAELSKAELKRLNDLLFRSRPR